MSKRLQQMKRCATFISYMEKYLTTNFQYTPACATAEAITSETGDTQTAATSLTDTNTSSHCSRLPYKNYNRVKVIVNITNIENICKNFKKTVTAMLPKHQVNSFYQYEETTRSHPGKQCFVF